MGFELRKVVQALVTVGVPTNEGRDYNLSEAYMGDVTAYLLGDE